MDIETNIDEADSAMILLVFIIFTILDYGPVTPYGEIYLDQRSFW